MSEKSAAATQTPPPSLFAGWLGELPVSLAGDLLARGEAVTAVRGEVIYGIGDEDRALWGIAVGAVRMNIATNEHEQRLGHVIGPGFWFGEYELLTGAPRAIEMQAAGTCQLLRVPAHAIEALARTAPDIWRWIGRLSAQHTLLALSAADDLMLRSAVGRVAAILLRLSGRRGGHPASLPADTIAASQQDLAEALNLSRATTGQILRDMERDGLVSLDYGAVSITRPDQLADRVVGG